VPETDVPERLRRLNYIFFRDGQSFARPLRELAETLRQDVEWIREHTRLSEAAARWKARDRGTGAASGLLLRGDELSDARVWVARRKEHAPEITALITSFLTASETRAATLANEERERLAERERLVAERERAQHNVRRVQRRWFAILAVLAIVVVLGTGAGLWSVFNGWRDLMTTRAQFIAGIVDQQSVKGDHVGAMLIGLDALPDETSKGIRQRVLKLDMSAVHALDGAWRNWLSGWGERTVLRGHTGIVGAVAFSSDGTRVLTGSFDNTARLWDAATGKAVAALAGHTASVGAVAFSPDGTRVLTGSGDHTARLWDAATGKAVATLAGHTGTVGAVAFSPDGTRVLTGSWDNTARLWDAATGKAVATLAGHTGIVGAVAFSPDGTRVLTGSWDHTARLWSVFKSAQALMDIVRTTVPRCLTPMQREAFYLGTPPPRWCYERNLWPFADHGQSYIEGGSSPYGPPPASWDEKLLSAWDRSVSRFSRPVQSQRKDSDDIGTRERR
jgi:WD domain, G-beta repeat